MPFGKKSMALVAAALLASLLSGCAGGPDGGLRTHFVSFDQQQRNEYMLAQPGAYRIQQGDKLALTFAYLEDKDRRGIIVLPDGSVTLPEIDRVIVEGRTVSEVDSLITTAYGRSYRNPDLSVLVEESVGRQVYVLGEVQRPGLYPVPYGGIGILSAISVAGGFTEDAQKTQTVLVRMTEEGYLLQEIDLSLLNSLEGMVYTGVSLEAYDVIYVPRSRIGDFAYFSESVLAGIADLTRVVTDIKILEDGYYRR